jgi:spore coat polysaccharide biosynthesis protein SpsF
MPFFYENPQRFRILLVNHLEDHSALRWTVDTPEDLELLRQIYARFDNRDDFAWGDILALVQREPELTLINAAVQAKHYQAVDNRFGDQPK